MNTISSFGECKTKQFPISGGEVGGAKGFKEFMEDKAYRGEFIGITHEEALHLASFYGSNVSILFDMIEKEKELSDLFHVADSPLGKTSLCSGI